MGKAPAFQMYASDFLVDTNDWTVDEVGIYLRLLLSEWVNGVLPNDEKRLSRIAGCDYQKFKKKWFRVSTKFKLNGDGFLFNERLEFEREKQDKYRELQSKKGKMGGRPQKSRGFSPVLTEQKPEESSSSSSSSSRQKKIYKRKVLTDEEWKEEIIKLHSWINWDDLNREMDTWLLNNPKRQKTRKFIANWILNKQKDKPMEVKTKIEKDYPKFSINPMEDYEK